MEEEDTHVRLSALPDDELRRTWKKYQGDTKPQWITDRQSDERRTRRAVEMIFLLQQEAERRGISLREEAPTGGHGAPGVRPAIRSRQCDTARKAMQKKTSS